MVAQELASYERYRQIMKMEQSDQDFGVYGLGDVVSLDEYERLSGVDFRGLAIAEKGRNGLFR